MRILLTFIVASVLLVGPSNCQELPPVFGISGRRIQVSVGEEKLDFRSQIQKLFERDGLNRSNADLLEYLFQSSDATDFRSFEKSSSKGLRLASAWHLVMSQAIVSARLMEISETARIPIKISPESKSHFLKMLSQEVGFEIPEVIKRHFDEIEFSGSKWFSSLDELRQNPQRLSINAKSEFMSARTGLDLETTPTRESSISVGSKLVAFAAKDGPIVQELDGQNKPLWTRKLDHSWGGSAYVNYEFVLTTGPKNDKVLVFIGCPDRFSINVLKSKSGDLLWSFCSNWPLVP